VTTTTCTVVEAVDNTVANVVMGSVFCGTLALVVITWLLLTVYLRMQGDKWLP